MGNYIYALRSPNKVKKVIVSTPAGTETVSAGSMSYLYKPSWSNDEFNRPYERAADRLRKLWNGILPPVFVAMTNDKENHIIKVGQGVYSWPGKRVPFTYNDGSETMKFYGTIISIVD